MRERKWNAVMCLAEVPPVVLHSFDLFHVCLLAASVNALTCPIP